MSFQETMVVGAMVVPQVTVVLYMFVPLCVVLVLLPLHLWLFVLVVGLVLYHVFFGGVWETVLVCGVYFCH